MYTQSWTNRPGYPRTASRGLLGTLGTLGGSTLVTNPNQSLASAVKSLKPGDTLQLRGGIYNAALINVIPPGISWNAPVTLMSYPGERAVIQAPGGAPHAIYFQEPSQYIVLDNMVIDASAVAGGGDGIKISSQSAAGVGGAHHIRVQNCEVANAPGMGTLITLGSDYNEFLGCYYHNNGWCGPCSTPSFGYAFYISSAYNLLDSCEIIGSGSSGVHLFYIGYNGVVNYNTLRNCRIINNNSRTSGRGSGIIVQVGTGTVIDSCEVSGNYNGISIDFASNVKITSSSIHDNQAAGVQIGMHGGNAYNVALQGNQIRGNHPDIEDQGKNTTINGAAPSTAAPTIPSVPSPPAALPSGGEGAVITPVSAPASANWPVVAAIAAGLLLLSD